MKPLILTLFLFTSTLTQAQDTYETTIARRIYAKTGVVLHPSRYNLAQLCDYENRIFKVESIHQEFGIKLDAFKYSLAGLEDRRQAIGWAIAIKNVFGGSFEWSAYTGAEMQSKFNELSAQFPQHLAQYEANQRAQAPVYTPEQRQAMLDQFERNSQENQQRADKSQADLQRRLDKVASDAAEIEAASRHRELIRAIEAAAKPSSFLKPL